MNKIHLYIKVFLILFIGFLFIKNIIFIQKQQLWSPIDEYAHMDYVVKISAGKIPKLSDRLAPEIIKHIQAHPEKNLHKNLVDINQLGFAGFSYEAHHPPLYYIILSIPNTILNWLNIELFTKLKCLRLFSYLLCTIGLLLVIPIFKELNISGQKVPTTYALGCVVFGLLIATHQRYGLGNNMLSPLTVNLTCLFLLRAINDSFKKNFIFSVLFGCLSLLTSYTNILIIPFLFLLSSFRIVKWINLKSFLISIMIIAVTIGIILFWKEQSYGDKNTKAFIYLMLNLLIPPGFLKYRYFIEIFFVDTFTLTFLKPGFSIATIFTILLGTNGILSLLLVKTLLQKGKWIAGVYILALVFLVGTFILNKYIGGVNWYALRHYMGFIPVFYICGTAYILLLYAKARKL